MTSPTSLRHRLWLAAGLGLLGLGLLGQLFVAPHRFFADDLTRILELKELLHGHRVPHGRYSLMGPLFSSPLVWLDDAVGTDDVFVQRYNTLLLAGALAALLALFWKKTEPRKLVGIALLVFFASMAPQHLIFYYGEVFTASTVAIGLALVCLDRPVLGWALAGLGAINAPPAIVGLGFAALAWVIRTRRMRHLAPLGLIAACIALEWLLRHGGVLAAGYDNDGAGPRDGLPYYGYPGFSYPLLLGLLSLLFSFGRGVLFFAPGLWLAPMQRAHEPRDPLEDTFRLWLWFLGGLLAVYSSWWAWHGANFWGPRFFLFAAFPAAYLLVERLDGARFSLPHNALALGLLTFSFWVGIDAVIYRFGDVPERLCSQAQGAACLYAPELSPLWVPVWTGKTLDGPMLAMSALAVAAFVLASSTLWVTTARQTLEQARIAARALRTWRI